jgi:phosphoribosylformimino-5-aminoimidazole carboxamide ribotide isomerase
VILLPAVDIRDGRAVRLRQGRFDDETVYADDPLEAARSFSDAGADYLHVVDLDGARDGEPANLRHLERIKSELPVTVQYGGGLRSPASVGSALSHGADRVVLGTAAFQDRDFLEAALGTWGTRIVVAIDVRGGELSVAGWTRETGAAPEDVIRELQRLGASLFVYTNADRDGMLEGPDLDEVRRIGAVVRGSFLYSGGIGSLDDLRALKGLRLDTLAGVISGKALYEGRFGVREARDALAVTI